jgi:hypothetical protein
MNDPDTVANKEVINDFFMKKNTERKISLLKRKERK